MTEYARIFSHSEWVLRSGGAEGADKAFYKGAINPLAEIYTASNHIPEWAFRTVDKYHPAPDRLSEYARRLHARNAMIILGADGDNPADLVMCWTKGGKKTGGTAQGIRIAEDYRIPVINLGLLV